MPTERPPRKIADKILPIEIEPGIHAIVLNTSDEGLGFRALAPVTQSGTIRFFFDDDGQRVQASGELAWLDTAKQNGGLRFGALPQWTRERIRNWIEFSTPPPMAATPAQRKAPSPTTNIPPPASSYVPPPPAPHAPAAGLPSPTPHPGYIVFEEDSQYLEKSPSRFFPGFLVGVIAAAILAAALFYVYGNPVSALLARWGSSPAATISPSAPSAASVAPSAGMATPPASSPTPAPPPAAPNASASPNPPAPPLSPAEEAAILSAPISSTPRNSKSPASPPATAPTAASEPAADAGQDDLDAAQRYLETKTSADRAAAVRLLWSAVEKGNVTAEITLANLYARGDGVAKNCDQARVLLQAAAEKRSKEAAQQLAAILRGGCR